MRVKTSITLPADLIARIDRKHKNRSALLERAAEAWLRQTETQTREHRDAEIINHNADRLNDEAMDALEYQHLP